MSTMQTRPDAELIARYRTSRDESAFGEIVSRHGPMVYRVCLRLIGDPHEAEDCSQAVFVVLVRKIGSLRRKVNLAAWLYGVARHVSLRAAEARANRAKRQEGAAMIRQEGRDGTSGADGTALAELLYREMGGLPRVERQAVILRYLEGHSEIEAAAVAGCPQGTLSRRASKGLSRLRERLLRRGHVLPLASLAVLLEAEAGVSIPETLLPFILTTSKLAATGAAVETAGSAVFAIAEGVMKAMFWTKVKMLTCIAVTVGALGFVGPVVVSAVRAQEVPGPAGEGGKDNAAPKETGLFAVVKGGKYGYMNAAGQLVIPAQFDSAGEFRNGLAAVEKGARWEKDREGQIRRLSGKFGYIDEKGKFVIEPKFDGAERFSEGFAAVRVGAKWGYADRTGKIAVEPRYMTARAFSEGRGRVQREDHSCNYVDKEGKTFPVWFGDGASDFSEGLAAVRARDFTGYIDLTGKRAIDKPFDSVKPFSEGLAAVEVDGKWGYIDRKGKFVIKPRFDYGGRFSEGMAPVNRGAGKWPITGKWGFIDRTGREVIAPQFDKVHGFSQGLAAVLVGRNVGSKANYEPGKWGFVDKTGKLVILAKFEQVGDFSNGVALVYLSRAYKLGYVSRQGKYVWTPTEAKPSRSRRPGLVLKKPAAPSEIKPGTRPKGPPPPGKLKADIRELSRNLREAGEIGKKRAAAASLASLAAAGRQDAQEALILAVLEENAVVVNLAIDKLGDRTASISVLRTAADPPAVGRAAKKVANMLLSRKPGNRGRTGLALSRMGTPAVEVLTGLLSVKDDNAVLTAARALGDIGDPQAVPHLARTLKRHTYVHARIASAEALGKIGSPTALEPLKKALKAIAASKGKGDNPPPKEPRLRNIKDLESPAYIKALRAYQTWQLSPDLRRAIEKAIFRLETRKPSAPDAREKNR
jgi:RNA polymerase sigma factor (sigma-70 family)